MSAVEEDDDDKVERDVTMDAHNEGRSLDLYDDQMRRKGSAERPRSPIALLEKGLLYPFAELPLPRNHLDVGRRMRELQRSVHTTLDKFAYKFMQSAEKEKDIKHRWKSMRVQIEEVRNNVNVSMEKLLTAVVDRDAEVNALKHTITVLQRQLKESNVSFSFFFPQSQPQP